MAMPCAAAIFRVEAKRRFRSTGRVAGRRVGAEAMQAGSRGADFHRRADAATAPTRCSCRKTCGIDESGRVVLPAGLKRGRQCAPRGRGYSRRHRRAEGRPAPAAAGCRARGGVRADPARRDAGASASRCSRPATNWSRRERRAQPAQLFDSNRFMLMAMLQAARLRGQRSRHFARRSRLAGGRAEAGGRPPRPDADHRRRFDRRGGSRQGQRRKRRLAGAVADGDQARTSGGDGNHRRHAVHRTCPAIRWRVLSPSSMWCGRRCWRCRARQPRSWFRCRCAPPSATRRRSAAANMSASTLRKGQDGALEAIKFPREGAGLLSSLVDTDGLVELGERHQGRARRGRIPGYADRCRA